MTRGKREDRPADEALREHDGSGQEPQAQRSPNIREGNYVRGER